MKLLHTIYVLTISLNTFSFFMLNSIELKVKLGFKAVNTDNTLKTFFCQIFSNI